MRGCRLLVGVVAMAAALTACGGGNDKAAKPKAKPTVSKEDKYLRAIWKSNSIDRSNWNGGTPTDTVLASFPPEWCSAAEEGHSVEWMLNKGGLYPFGDDWGTPEESAKSMIVLGITAYCPQYRDQVIEGLSDDGGY